MPPVPHERFYLKSFAVLAAAFYVLLAGALLTTPTLNWDDLGYPELAQAAAAQGKLGQVFFATLINADVGVFEIRTYGLARTVQVAVAFLFGKNPVPTYLFLAVLHLAGGAVVFKLVKKISGSPATALFAAVAWAASPAVLPYLKNLHHFLYLIAPFSPLLLWLYLSRDRAMGSLPGTALLVLSWMLGEAAIIPAVGAVAIVFWSRRDRRILWQGTAAAGLLVAYLAFQKLAINDPDVPQRFVLRPALHLGETLVQVWENGKALLGHGYYDAELNARVRGINPWHTLSFALTAATAAIVALPLLSRVLPRCRERTLAVAVAMLCPLSLLLYLATSALLETGLAVRYTVPFFALLPLAAIVAGVLTLPARAAQGLAAVLAAGCMAFSLGLLERAEVMVNAPTRALLAELKPGTALVARHGGWSVADDGATAADYPGLVSPYRSGLADPLRAAWAGTAMLRLYANVTFASRCARRGDGQIAVYFQGAETVFPAANVRAVGLDDRRAMTARNLSLDEACAAIP